MTEPRGLSPRRRGHQSGFFLSQHSPPPRLPTSNDTSIIYNQSKNTSGGPHLGIHYAAQSVLPPNPPPASSSVNQSSVLQAPSHAGRTISPPRHRSQTQVSNNDNPSYSSVELRVASPKRRYPGHSITATAAAAVVAAATSSPSNLISGQNVQCSFQQESTNMSGSSMLSGRDDITLMMSERDKALPPEILVGRGITNRQVIQTLDRMHEELLWARWRAKIMAFEEEEAASRAAFEAAALVQSRAFLERLLQQREAELVEERRRRELEERHREERERELMRLRAEAEEARRREEELLRLKEEARIREEQERELQRRREEARLKEEQEREIARLREEARIREEQERELQRLREEARIREEQEREIARLREEARIREEQEREILRLREEARLREEERVRAEAEEARRREELLRLRIEAEEAQRREERRRQLLVELERLELLERRERERLLEEHMRIVAEQEALEQRHRAALEAALAEKAREEEEAERRRLEAERLLRAHYSTVAAGERHRQNLFDDISSDKTAVRQELDAVRSSPKRYRWVEVQGPTSRQVVTDYVPASQVSLGEALAAAGSPGPLHPSSIASRSLGSDGMGNFYGETGNGSFSAAAVTAAAGSGPAAALALRSSSFTTNAINRSIANNRLPSTSPARSYSVLNNSQSMHNTSNTSSSLLNGSGIAKRGRGPNINDISAHGQPNQQLPMQQRILRTAGYNRAASEPKITSIRVISPGRDNGINHNVNPFNISTNSISAAGNFSNSNNVYQSVNQSIRRTAADMINETNASLAVTANILSSPLRSQKNNPDDNHHRLHNTTLSPVSVKPSHTSNSGAKHSPGNASHSSQYSPFVRMARDNISDYNSSASSRANSAGSSSSMVRKMCFGGSDEERDDSRLRSKLLSPTRARNPNRSVSFVEHPNSVNRSFY